MTRSVAPELYCNQRRLGPPLFAALRTVLDTPQPPEITSFLAQGSEGVERQSCAIASMATAVNLLLGKPVLTLRTVPPIMRALLGYHNKITVLNADGPQPWQVFNQAGPRYHAMATVARAFGLGAEVVWQPLPKSPAKLPVGLLLHHLAHGGVANISVRNQFVGVVTGASYSPADSAGHILTLCRIIDDSAANSNLWLIDVADPVADSNAPPTMPVTMGTLLEYSMAGPETVRGIIYARRPSDLTVFAAYRPPNVHYPQPVIDGLRQCFTELGIL